MKLILVILFIFINSLSFGADFVDLGKKGNAQGMQNYQDYVGKLNHCQTTENDLPRIMITSFGPYTSKNINISQAVLETFSKEKLTLTEKSFGAEVLVKKMNLEGVDVEVCLVNLEVQWGLSSAIVIHEAQKFKPDFILMMGHGVKGKIIIETTAKNTANRLNGYNYQGKGLEKLNAPNSFSLMHKRNQANRFEKMTWKAQEIYDEINPLENNSPISLKIKISKGHRKKNIYVCNALAFATLHALKNNEIYLFKDELRLTTELKKEIPAGFLHLPNLRASEQSLEMLEYLSNLVKRISILHI